jgi:thiamine pyrophosphate-dependent acetolactate synthase large subunit-like protein
MKAIDRWRTEEVMVSATTALREWSSVSRRRDLDLDLSDCMDKAASLGLGVALAQHRKVVVLDCDSVLRSNLAALITVGNAGPDNLVHILLEDASHLSTDGMPIPGLEGIDFAAHARESGYPRTYRFEDLEEFVVSLEEVMAGPGPTFVSLKVVHDRDVPDYPPGALGDSVRAVKATLEREAQGPR